MTLRPHYYEPAGFSAALADCPALAGGAIHFSAVIRAVRESKGARRQTIPVEQLPSDRLIRLTAPRPPFAGVTMTRPHIMGVDNVTPDSFSDGGDRYDSGQAVADGLAMWEAGAAFVDVGGESTRPGSEPPSLEEELQRVIPVVRQLAAQGVRVSVDARRAAVMAEAIAAGAAVINDISAFTSDPDSLKIAAESGLPVILMHMLGDPKTMQQAPRYEEVVLDVYDYLEARIAVCGEAGIDRSRICIDPGIGFGKTTGHNLELLSRLATFQD